MTSLTCDGFPLLDVRDDDFILGNPRIKTEVNTVGEGSFKIYFNHPYINKLIPLLSVFEAKDENGVFFRGRMTENTKDIVNGKDVDLEGAMSYFNDSAVRPYVFPDDFLEDPEYQAAAAETAEQAALDGGVVRFLLKWYIDRHNEQVEPFQQFKLGNVTVYDKNNFIERAAADYPSTWKELSDKLFKSSLGGYLCIRYEEDGNYIDYLREFTEVNEQGISYGENLLDLSQNVNAAETYSAIIPLGKEDSHTEENGEVYEGLYGDIVGGSTVKQRLTIESLPDGDITDDIVKRGDTLYSKKAVAAYGWRYAPRDATTWDDVTEAENLQSNGVEFLEGDATKIPNTIKVTAVDLNCTDKQIRTFRIYKKIPVYTPAHGINDSFDLTALDRDLLNPQNTKITVGKTVMTITEYQSKQQTNIQNIIGSINAKFATNDAVAAGFKSTKTLIEETEEGIFQSVSAIYATKDSLNKYATTASLQVMSAGIMQSVSGTYATIDALEEVEGKIALEIVEADDGSHYSQLSADVDKIVFNSGEIVINSGNFTLDEAGNIGVKGGKIGDFEIVNGSYLSLVSNSAYFDADAAISMTWNKYDNYDSLITSYYTRICPDKVVIASADRVENTAQEITLRGSEIAFYNANYANKLPKISYIDGALNIGEYGSTGILKGTWTVSVQATKNGTTGAVDVGSALTDIFSRLRTLELM